MMSAVARHEDRNRMSASAVAACMAPLLFRPLLSGECQLSIVAALDSDPTMHVEDADGAAAQIFAATQAANQANTMTLFLLEHLEDIFVSAERTSGQPSKDMKTQWSSHFRLWLIESACLS